MPHVPGTTLKPLVKLPRDPNDCWPWLGRISDDGRACKTFEGKSTSAQRWIWEQLFGPIPAGLVIFNTCGNKACINPYHLRCGTQAEANRSGPGSSERPIVLTPGDVLELRCIAREDRTTHRAQIEASKLGVSISTIREVWRGSVWRRPKPNHGPRRKAA